jgi:ribosomal-protein-alanine N-acetyltransferase
MKKLIGAEIQKARHLFEGLNFYQPVIFSIFEKVGVNRIESRHDLNNQNSGKVMLRCGMKCEGIKRQGDYNYQGICDSVEYGILAEDYYKEK